MHICVIGLLSVTYLLDLLWLHTKYIKYRSWSPDLSAFFLRLGSLEICSWFKVHLSNYSMLQFQPLRRTTLQAGETHHIVPQTMLRCRLRCLHDSRIGVHRHQRCWAKQMRNLPTDPKWIAKDWSNTSVVSWSDENEWPFWIPFLGGRYSKVGCIYLFTISQQTCLIPKVSSMQRAHISWIVFFISNPRNVNIVSYAWGFMSGLNKGLSLES